MKKIVLLVLAVHAFNVVFSQTDNDSLLMTKQIDELILLNPINSFEEAYTGVARLEKIRKKCKYKALRTKILNYYIDCYNYYFQTSNSPISFLLNEFAWDEYDEAARKKLMRLLSGEYSKEEVDAFVAADIKLGVQQCLLNESDQIPHIVGKTGKTPEQVIDSLRIYFTDYHSKHSPSKITRYHSAIIFTVGWLDMKEALPVIKHQVEQNRKNENYPHKTASLALARLGDKENLEYYRKYITETELKGDNNPNSIKTQDVLNTLIYICDTISLEVVLGQLGSSNIYRCNWDDEAFPIGHEIIYYIRMLISNYPYDYYKFGGWPCIKEFVIPVAIPNTIAWVEANKGNYKLNRELYIKYWLN